MLNGATSLIMMKSDVLNDFDTIKVCVGYELNGERIDYFPFEADADNIKPIYKSFPGWKCDVSVCRTYDELPTELKDYIAYIEQETGVSIDIISVGPDRSETIMR
jgi:adenylosuccinate synthase